MSSLSDIHHRLSSEWSRLESQWHLTRSQWSDAVGDGFEKEYWHAMEDFMPRFLRELQHVDETIERALRTLKH